MSSGSKTSDSARAESGCGPAGRPPLPDPQPRFQSPRGEGGGDLGAMRSLMPVWKRLADVFPSMAPWTTVKRERVSFV